MNLCIYIVRHGETQANSEGRYLGSLDIGLTATGIRQAEELRARLPFPVDAIVVSPLLRAQQTARIFFDQTSTLHTMSDFRERDVGVFDGLTQAEARILYPALWSQNITRRWEIGPPGGESIAEFAHRICEGINKLHDAYRGKVIVLVAHGFVAKMIRALAQDDFSDFFEWRLSNGEIFQVKLDGRRAINVMPPGMS
jgi:broad specificity phosphatase PhoE